VFNLKTKPMHQYYIRELITIALLLIAFWYFVSGKSKVQKIRTLTSFAFICSILGCLAIIVSTYNSGDLSNLFKLALPLTTLILISRFQKNGGSKMM